MSEGDQPPAGSPSDSPRGNGSSAVPNAASNLDATLVGQGRPSTEAPALAGPDDRSAGKGVPTGSPASRQVADASSALPGGQDGREQAIGGQMPGDLASDSQRAWGPAAGGQGSSQPTGVQPGDAPRDGNRVTDALEQRAFSMNKLSTPELTVLQREPQVPEVTERREVAPVRVDVGPIARHEQAFVQLYYALEARRTSTMPLVVQFISPAGGAGASTVASGYARVAADDSSQPVLYIDCSGQQEELRPGTSLTLVEALRRGRPLSEAMVPAADGGRLLWARLSPGQRPMLNLGGERLQTLLDMLRGQYGVIVLDCDSTASPEMAALARYCDGTVLVVEAGRTRQTDIDSAKTLVERMGGQPVGVVLNRQKSVLPRWFERRR